MRQAARAVLAAVLFAAAPARAAWTRIDLPTPEPTLRAVAVTGPSQFQVSGSNGTYAVTGDGGRTWRQVAVPGGETLDFRGLAALDGRTTLLMSAGDGPAGQARIYRTGDAGRTWTLAFETRLPGSFLDAIVFRDRRSGLVLGDPIDGRWFLLRTHDGGRSWARTEGPPVQPGEAAFAASNSALFVGGRADAWIVSGGLARGRVFHSRDDGRAWTAGETPIAAGPTAGVFGGLALGPGRVVVVGGDYKDELRASPGVATTRDGAVWTLASQTGTPRLLEGVGRLDARRLLAVGPRGTSLSADDGRTWRQVDDEAFHAIACARGTCVAAGARGRVGFWSR